MSLFEILSKMNMAIAEFDAWYHTHKPTLDFTLLSEEQIWGKQQLEVLQKYGTAAEPTDLVVLSRAQMKEGAKTKAGNLGCWQYTLTESYALYVRSVTPNGEKGYTCPTIRSAAVRPVIRPDEAAHLIPTNRKTDENGIEIMEYGEYPQMLADDKTSRSLEDAFKRRTLKKTGKTYTFDSAEYDSEPFKPRSRMEYEFEGKKYIRFSDSKPHYAAYLSNGKKPKSDGSYWIEVQPIEWLADPSGAWVSKKCLIGGLQYATQREYDGDFSKTFMKYYLDTYFAKEMGHKERMTEIWKVEEQQRLDKALTGLSARLEKATGEEAVEAIKKRLMEAEKRRKVKTPSNRLHEAARIKRLRNARDILNEAAQQAYEAGDKALLNGIIDLSGSYAARYQGQQNRVAQRRAARRVQRKQGDRR